MAELSRQTLIEAFHEDLFDVLVARLRSEGFDIGMEQVFHANALLYLWVREEEPSSARLGALLGPVFCIDEEQQHRFRQVFDEVSRALAESAAGGSAFVPAPQPEPDIHRRAFWKGTAAFALMAVLLAVGIWQWPSTEPELPPEQEPPTAGELPPPEVEEAPETVAETPPIEPPPEGGDPPESSLSVSGSVMDLLGDPVSPVWLEVRARGEVHLELGMAYVDEGGQPALGPLPDDAVRLEGLAVSGDGDEMFLQHTGGGTYRDVQTNRVVGVSTLRGDTVSAVENGTVLVLATGESVPPRVISEGGGVRVYRTEGLAVLSSSGRYVFEMSTGDWNIHDVDVGDAVSNMVLPDVDAATAEPLAATFSRDERTIHVATRRGLLRVQWDPERGEASTTEILRVDTPLIDARFSRGGDSVAYKNVNGELTLRLGETTRSIEGPVDAFDIAEGQAIALDRDGDLSTYDAKGQVGSRRVDGARSVWISNDGRLVLVDMVDELALFHSDLSERIAFAGLSGHGEARSVPGTSSVGTDEELRIVAVASTNRFESYRLRAVFDAPERGEVESRFARNASARTELEVHVADPRYDAVEPTRLSLAADDPSETLTFRAELSPLPDEWRQLLGRNPATVRGVAFALPVALAFGWWARRRATRQAVLQARRPIDPPQIVREGFSATLDGLYRNSASVRAGIEARRPRPLGIAELDPVATVESSAERAGLFSPRFAPRMAMPGYLVLIDRRSVWDQLAKQMDEMVARLEDVGIGVWCYEFDRDPRAVRGFGGGPRRTLAELAATLGGVRLLLVSDGEGLCDRQTGKIAPWTRTFGEWPERALLTPIEPCHWSARETAITERGFRVVPASPDGLLRFLESLTDHDAADRQSWEWSPPLPATLEEDAVAHLSRRIPEADEREKLRDSLERYLGVDGYRWLCALAAYPSLEWEITLYLGQLLRTTDGSPLQREDRLLRLARLPWLRYGQMPEWLRAELLADLPDADQQTVRAALAALLDGAEHSGPNAFRLDFAFDQRRREPDRAGREAGEVARSHPPGDALRDPVFVSFLHGRRISLTDLRAPDRLRRLLFAEGRRAFGLRSGVGLVGAVLAGLFVSFVAGHWLDQFRDAIGRRASTISRVWTEDQSVAVETPPEMEHVILCGSPPQAFTTGRVLGYDELPVRCRADVAGWPIQAGSVRLSSALGAPTREPIRTEPVGANVLRLDDGTDAIEWSGPDRPPTPIGGQIRSLRGLDQAAVAGSARRLPFLPAGGFAAQLIESVELDPSLLSRLRRALGLAAPFSTPHVWTPEPLIDALWAPDGNGRPGFVTLNDSGLASRWVDGAFDFTYGGPRESTTMDASLEGDRLVTGGGGSARVWRLSDGELLATIPGELPVRDVAISRDASVIAVLRDAVTIWSESPWDMPYGTGSRSGTWDGAEPEAPPTAGLPAQEEEPPPPVREDVRQEGEAAVREERPTPPAPPNLLEDLPQEAQGNVAPREDPDATAKTLLMRSERLLSQVDRAGRPLDPQGIAELVREVEAFLATYPRYERVLANPLEGMRRAIEGPNASPE